MTQRQPSSDRPMATLDVPALRERLRRGREPLVSAFERAADPQHQAQLGRLLGARYALLLDELLQRVFPAALAVATVDAGPLVLAAVGGYGRGALALGSDLDVRLLAEQPERAQEVAEALLYPLWDVGLSVGHQVVTAKDMLAAACDDLPTATSLLDWRFLAGDAERSEGLLRRARGGLFELSRLRDFIARLDAEVEARHKRFGGSVYLLEPDVKNGPGGLRDVDVARWAARARWGVPDVDALVSIGVLVPRQLAAVKQARERLWLLRNALHQRAGRRRDRLAFDEQEALAEQLGYGGPLGEAVERLMSDYYRAARTVSRFRDMILARATPAQKRRRPSARDLGDGLQLFDGELTLIDHDLLQQRPALAMQALELAAARGCALRPSFRNALVGVCGDAGWTRRLRACPDASARFRRLVISCGETGLKRGSVMRELHDVGLLLAMIPEFGPVVGRVHHDTYHVYTVDVHSVAAVDRLVEIVRGDVVIDPEEGTRWGSSFACRLGAEITRPEVLFFATLLHDVGKAIGGRRHSERGAEMAVGILQRLGFAQHDSDAICRLIRHHLTMYLTATRRDIEDPATADELAQLVRDREGLRHLYLLTVADLSTTSPTSMTSWKAHMLDELFLATDRRLRADGDVHAEFLPRRCEQVLEVVAQPRTDRAEAKLGWPSVEFTRAYFASMPSRYLLRHEPLEIAMHAARVCEHLRTAETLSLFEMPQREGTSLCVIARDRLGLLADITAALAASRLHVHAANIYSCRAQPLVRLARADAAADEALTLAVDTFRVQASSAAPLHTALPRLGRALRSLVDGDLSAAELLESRPQRRSMRAGPAVAPRVLIDDRASPQHTVIEVLARDQPRLLHALAAAMHELGLSIARAKIATEGTRVVDVFYVSERDGTKVSMGERAEEIRQRLRDLVREPKLSLRASTP